MITAADATEIHDALAGSGFEYWIGGGWGVDALVGRQTRDHDDLDISIPSPTLRAVLDLVAAMGFEPHADWLPTRIALRDEQGREIDIHPLVFESDGSAWLPGLDDSRFLYPADSFTSGTIGDRTVPCISAELQAVFHTGYEPQPKDIADIATLRRAGLIPA